MITLALVGRTNVGKSTLFNALTRSKAAITNDTSGVTRDRRYSTVTFKGRSYTIVDTGGLEKASDTLTENVHKQTQYAIDEADWLGLVVDGKVGLTSQDKSLVKVLRASGKKILLIVNKVEGTLSPTEAMAEFSSTGIPLMSFVSAIQKQGLQSIIHHITDQTLLSEATSESSTESDAINIAIIGRPNAGKSTLINRLVGNDRQIVSSLPGTTRESIKIDITSNSRQYTLVDTAGIRRLSNVHSTLETAAVRQSLSALRESAVVILLIDANEGLTDNDLRLLQRIVESGRALLILCNKWDLLNEDDKFHFKKTCNRRLRFAPFAIIGFISGLYGTGVKEIFLKIDEAFKAATTKLSTSTLTRLLEEAVSTHTPPRSNRRTPKLRYAHPGGYNPPTIIIHGSHLSDINLTYKRYLEKFYQTHLKLMGTPVRVEFKDKR